MTANKHLLQGIDIPVTGYQGFRRTLKEHANLDDTLENMQRIVLRDAHQVQELAHQLQGNTIEQTTRNIWEFIRENLTYQFDAEGIEELRTPARTLNDEIFDCDDATILISALLLNLGIKHEYRITAYQKKGKFTHIYPVAYDEQGKAFVIDTVPEIPHFNYEEQPIMDLKIVDMIDEVQHYQNEINQNKNQNQYGSKNKQMELQELTGVTQVTQQEMQQELIQDINQPFHLSGVDEEEDILLEGSFLSGLAEVATEQEADIVITTKEDAIQLLENGILAEIHKAKTTLTKEKKNPTVLSQIVNINKELEWINEVIAAWTDEEEREETIENAIAENSAYKNFYQAIQMSLDELDNEAENLNGIADEAPVYLAKVQKMSISDILLSEETNENELQGLGFFKKLRKKIGGGLKKVFKKVGAATKKVVKAVVRFNPATILVRNAILLVLKINLFHLASRLIYGYLTQEQAEAKNLDINEWRKVVNAKNKAEGFFTKIGGKAHNFRKAITKGKAAKKTGLHLNGLGEAVAASSTAAASGFVVFVKKLLSAINPLKLFKKKNKSNQQQATTEPYQITETSGNNYEFTNSSNEDFSTTAARMNQDADNNQATKTGFIQKIKNLWNQHKKKIIFVGITGIAGLVFLLVWNKWQKKKKNQLRGYKAAKTRARNRKNQSKKITAPKKRRTKPKTLGRGNTTVVKTPTKGRGKTRVYKQSSKNRLSLMHAKARQLQKKHPRMKYSKLLSMASKQI